MQNYLAEAAKRTCTLQELAANWRVTRITLRCPTQGTLARDPAFAGRIRGALGAQFKLSASKAALNGGPCDWSAPCALDVLFNLQGHLTARLELPRPWALACLPLGGDLLVRLSLFGIAGDWAGEVADALVRALRAGLSSGLRSHARIRLDVCSRAIEMAEGIATVSSDGPVMLEFVTPLMLRHGQVAHHAPESLLKSLGNRISGLARWHGCALVLDERHFSDTCARLAQDAVWEAVRPTGPWASHSSRHRDRKRLEGVTGRLLMPQPDDTIGLLLALGESAQAGGKTTHGLGLYRLSALPPAATGANRR